MTFLVLLVADLIRVRPGHPEPGRAAASVFELVQIQQMLEDALGVEVHITTQKAVSRFFRDELETQAVKAL